MINNTKLYPQFGDVIGMDNFTYQHYGIYVNNFSVIHYAPKNGDINNIYIHEVTFKEFQKQAPDRTELECFICDFPKTYGKPRIRGNIKNPVWTISKPLDIAFAPIVDAFDDIKDLTNFIINDGLDSFVYDNPKFEPLIKTIKKWFRTEYYLYSPEETVERARSQLYEKEYNLFANNCECFVLWCKTGIGESHQVKEILENLMLTIPIKFIIEAIEVQNNKRNNTKKVIYK
jgi:hypothetical protein